MKIAEKITVAIDDLHGLLERIQPKVTDDDYVVLESIVDLLSQIIGLLQAKRLTIHRLRKMIFGASTERTSDVLGSTHDDDSDEDESDDGDPSSGDSDDQSQDDASTQDEEDQPKGHGKNGADAFTGANRLRIPHSHLCAYDGCPGCGRGKLYPASKPGVELRFEAHAPVDATVYELEKLRCGLCGEIFTADLPEEAGKEKYDMTVGSMIANLKYGSGMPFNRLANLQESCGIPLPTSTQWDIVAGTADACMPVYGEVVRCAAEGDVLHNDDTAMKILGLPNPGPGERKGVYTSGIVSRYNDHQIAVFSTGRTHAGESLADILEQRSADEPPPVQMCDGLERNLPADLDTVVGNCTAHARRKFVELADIFPDECTFVLEAYKTVYKNEAAIKEARLSVEERLRYHQENSQPVLEELHTWLKRQFKDKLVEPNSSLGTAISYVLNRWERLTLFLRVPGAPIDNNPCERVLKVAILHRKNALFYKTQRGAQVGDVLMTLIHTSKLCGTNPFEYLTALQRYEDVAAQTPADWLPWNYMEALQTTRSPP